MILPRRDACRVKVTDFIGLRGDKFNNVSYACDETVYIIRGRVQIQFTGLITGGVGTWNLPAGTTYHVRAGESYSIRFIEETEAICFFSVAANGTLPDDE